MIAWNSKEVKTFYKKLEKPTVLIRAKITKDIRSDIKVADNDSKRNVEIYTTNSLGIGSWDLI